MPAFTFSAKNANFSIGFDSITIYSKKTLEKQVALFITACHKIMAVEFEVPTSPMGSNNLHHKIRTDGDFQRYIHRNDDDHQLFHADNFDMEENHSHIKFKMNLTLTKLSQIVGIMASMDFISEAEKNDFLNMYKMRFVSAKNKLEALLKQDKQKDIEAIKEFIKNCSDNDILTYIHEQLTGNKFDYLRAIQVKPVAAAAAAAATTAPAAVAAAAPAATTAVNDKQWISLNETNNVVVTSKGWAMLEECFTIKIAENIRRNSTVFSQSVARAYADEFQHDYSWFAMNHKRTNTAAINNGFAAFANADTTTLDKEFESHFTHKRKHEKIMSTPNPSALFSDEPKAKRAKHSPRAAEAAAHAPDVTAPASAAAAPVTTPAAAAAFSR